MVKKSQLLDKIIKEGQLPHPESEYFTILFFFRSKNETQTKDGLFYMKDNKTARRRNKTFLRFKEGKEITSYLHTK